MLHAATRLLSATLGALSTEMRNPRLRVKVQTPPGQWLCSQDHAGYGATGLNTVFLANHGKAHPDVEGSVEQLQQVMLLGNPEVDVCWLLVKVAWHRCSMHSDPVDLGLQDAAK